MRGGLAFVSALASTMLVGASGADPQQLHAPDRLTYTPVEPSREYASHDRALLPVLRAAPGASARFGENVAFAFDLIAGARIGLTRGASQ